MKFTIELDNRGTPALHANGVRLPGDQTISQHIDPYATVLTVQFRIANTNPNKFEWVTYGTSTES